MTSITKLGFLAFRLKAKKMHAFMESANNAPIEFERVYIGTYPAGKEAGIGVSYRLFLYDWQHGFVEAISLEDGYRLGYAIEASISCKTEDSRCSIPSVSHIGIYREQYGHPKNSGLNNRSITVWRFDNALYQKWLKKNKPTEIELS